MKNSIESFFQNYAKALLSYSAEKVSQFYQVPLTVYSDNGIQQVTEMSEIETFWKEGLKPYKAQEIKKSIPEILSEEQLSETIFISKVLWKNYDSTDTEVAKETNFYILSRNNHELKISGLIIMTN